jgi:hypothetical protein
MMIFLAYVDTLDTVFDPALHAVLGDSGFSGLFEQLEGEVASVTIVRPQTGWAILSAAQKPFVLLSESPTGNPADAVLFARGRIVGVPGDLFGATQTIVIKCAPANLLDVADAGGTVDGPLITWARANKSSSPETCLLTDEASKDDPATYLVGRDEVYHVDAATHQISTSRISAGPLFNLSDAHFHNSEEYPQAQVDEMPASRAKMVLKTGWTQTIQAICDVAPKLNFPVGFSTLSPDFLTYADSDLPSGATDFAGGSGWEPMPERSRIRMGTGHEGPFFSGRRFSVSYTPIGSSPISPFVLQHNETLSFKRFDFRADYFYMRGTYSQEREEEVEVVLDLPIQSIPGVVAVTDEGEIATIDLTTDTSAQPWEPGDYELGDRVSYNGRIWECNETHTSEQFFRYKLGQQRTYVDAPPDLNAIYATSPAFYWTPVPSTAPLKADASEFFATDDGRQVIAHAVCRLRRVLLQRARCITVSVRYRWEDARHVTLKNLVRIETPLTPGGEVSAIVGKVVGIVREWGGEFGPTITLTLGVSLGTGATETTAEDLNGPYSEPYWPDGYLDEPANLYGVAGDTEFVVDQDKLYRPINGDALRNPNYSVVSVVAENLAVEQRTKAAFAGLAGKDPRAAVQQNPTKIRLQMRDLATEGVISRGYYVAGEILSSPRGIDLVDGDEP